MGAFALTEGRDGFADRIAGYFRDWREALAQALIRAGRPAAEADSLAEDAVLTIQGGLVPARASTIRPCSGGCWGGWRGGWCGSGRSASDI